MDDQQAEAILRLQGALSLAVTFESENPYWIGLLKVWIARCQYLSLCKEGISLHHLTQVREILENALPYVRASTDRTLTAQHLAHVGLLDAAQQSKARSMPLPLLQALKQFEEMGDIYWRAAYLTEYVYLQTLRNDRDVTSDLRDEALALWQLVCEQNGVSADPKIGVPQEYTLYSQRLRRIRDVPETNALQ
jgi:hypothetical protein